MAVLVTRLKACVADNWTRGLLLCNSGEQTPSSHSSCHNLLLLLYSFCVMIGYPILVSKPWNGQEVFWATVRIWWQELHSKSATFHCLVRSEPPQGMGHMLPRKDRMLQLTDHVCAKLFEPRYTMKRWKAVYKWRVHHERHLMLKRPYRQGFSTAVLTEKKKESPCGSFTPSSKQTRCLKLENTTILQKLMPMAT